MVAIARWISYVIYFYLVTVEVLLGLGFFLLLFGANPAAGFTEWVYRSLERVMDPFRAIFAPIELGTTSGNVPSIFATSVLFAMIIYGIVALMMSTATTWLTVKLRKLETEEAELERQIAEAATPTTPV